MGEREVLGMGDVYDQGPGEARNSIRTSYRSAHILICIPWKIRTSHNPNDLPTIQVAADEIYSLQIIDFGSTRSTCLRQSSGCKQKCHPGQDY